MRKNAKRNLKKQIRYDKNKIRKEKFKVYNFKYLPKEDAYLCPKGAKLTRANNMQYERVNYKQYRTKECTRCRYHNEYTSEYKKTIKDRFDWMISLEIIIQKKDKRHIKEEGLIWKEDSEYYSNHVISKD